MSRVSLFGAFALLFSFSLHAELPPNLLAPCEAREANIEHLNSYLKEPAASGCIEQIKKGRDICFGQTEGSLTDFGTGGTVNTAQQSFDAHQSAVRAYSSHALKCQEEADVIHSRCREMADGLATARRQNQATTDEYSAKRSSAARGSAYELRMHQHVLDGIQIDGELSRARTATTNAYQKAGQILDRQRQCYTNKAIIYADARDQAGVVMASAAGQNPQHALADPGIQNAAAGADGALPRDPVAGEAIERSLELSTRGVANTAADVLEPRIGDTIANGTRIGGKVGAGLPGAVTGLVEPSVVGVTQDVADFAAGQIFTPKNAIRFSGVGTFLVAVFEPTPISVCSQLFHDATSAYLANCPVYVPQSLSSNENAIRTLSGK